jgi:hypothetical protein
VDQLVALEMMQMIKRHMRIRPPARRSDSLAGPTFPAQGGCGRPDVWTCHAILPACIAMVVAAGPVTARDNPALLAAEHSYAALLDAYGARETIDTGLTAGVEGKGRDFWVARFDTNKHVLEGWLVQLGSMRLTREESAVLSSLRAGLADYGGSSTSAAEGRCADLSLPNQSDKVLRLSLLACFREIGNHISFAGREMTRVSVLQLLQTLEPEAKREQLFLALRPLWQVINGDDQPSSPYRRRIASAAVDARRHGSAVDAAARSLGWTTPELESALIEVLHAWRSVAVSEQLEPWDYRYYYAAASRALSSQLTRGSLQTTMSRFYQDLGVDLRAMQVTYDFEPRIGKTPFAYTDFIHIGQWVNDTWRPTRVRVSETVEDAGLDILGEMIHETGHVVHYMAVRARPAYFVPDNFLAEAFANIPAWSLHEPAWQQKYLGRAVCRRDGLRERYALAMLDIAWTVFEMRMLRDPEASPNQVWTELTSQYLGITPHPELAWWAQRTQLVDTPGYMANYGAGAILTADLRARVEQSVGQFDTGNRQWYSWVSQHLLRQGSQLKNEELFEREFGRKPSAAALIADIQSIAARDPTCESGKTDR